MCVSFVPGHKLALERKNPSPVLKLQCGDLEKQVSKQMV